jgi:hypothetical protein
MPAFAPLLRPVSTVDGESAPEAPTTVVVAVAHADEALPVSSAKTHPLTGIPATVVLEDMLFVVMTQFWLAPLTAYVKTCPASIFDTHWPVLPFPRKLAKVYPLNHGR